MKKHSIFSILMTCLLALGLALVACSNGTTEDLEPPPSVVFSNTAKDGLLYKLTITQKPARAISTTDSFTPAAGDSYALEIIKEDKVENTSIGTVQGVANDTLTLKPSNSGASTFAVKVNGEQITNVTGSIAVQGSDTPVTPGAFAATTNSSGGGGGGGGGGGSSSGGGSVSSGNSGGSQSGSSQGGNGNGDNHNHNWGAWKVTTPATCTTDGVETRICSTQGESETGAITALGHDWGEWVVAQAPTEKEAGEEKRICTICEEEEINTILLGSEKFPFHVYDIVTLKKVGTGVDGWVMAAHYLQIANINVSTEDWVPISTFTGNYDGGNYTIDNLTTYKSSESFQGLFGRISGATVKNLKLNNVNIVGVQCVGGLAAVNDNGIITNCSVTGNVISTTFVTDNISYQAMNVGGLVGSNQNGGKVSYCFTSTNVIGLDEDTGIVQKIGGLVGNNYNSTVSYCYATGNVSVDGIRSGGLVGDNQGGTVTHCYATGNVGTIDNSDKFIPGGGYLLLSPGRHMGGLVGNNAGTITNTYATGNIICRSNAGGLIGINDGNVYNSVALNLNVTATSDYPQNNIYEGNNTGRVTGVGGINSNMMLNYARADMVITSPVHILDPGYYKRDGADITASDWGSATWWQNLGFTSDIWDFSNISATKLPTLKDMPGNPVQNPVVN